MGGKLPRPSPTASAAAVAGVAAILAAAAIAVPQIAGHEGVILRGYKDPIGIVTACGGHTKTAVLGKSYTVDQCMALLAQDTVEHGMAIAPCIKVPVPQDSLAAFISFSYNVGVTNFCTSTMLKKLNAGDLAGACAEFSRWTYAGGKQLPGLVARRKSEREFCERGLK